MEHREGVTDHSPLKSKSPRMMRKRVKLRSAEDQRSSRSPEDLHRDGEGLVIVDHGAEQQITQLGVGQEDDHEHHAEAEHILRTTGQGGG